MHLDVSSLSPAVPHIYSGMMTEAEALNAEAYKIAVASTVHPEGECHFFRVLKKTEPTLIQITVVIPLFFAPLIVHRERTPTFPGVIG
jgi:hypothetical protein